MSRRRTYQGASIAVMQRFFFVLDQLKQDRRITISGFCEDHGIDKRHLYAQRKDMGKGYFEIAWLLPLIERYGVSSDWLLLGKLPPTIPVSGSSQ